MVVVVCVCVCVCVLRILPLDPTYSYIIIVPGTYLVRRAVCERNKLDILILKWPSYEIDYLSLYKEEYRIFG